MQARLYFGVLARLTLKSSCRSELLRRAFSFEILGSCFSMGTTEDLENADVWGASLCLREGLPPLTEVRMEAAP